MFATAWMVLLPFALLVAIVLAARLGPFGARFGHTQACSFVCPVLGQDVDCRAVQEVYTGQWQRVAACSVYPGRDALPCGQDCVKTLNLGLPLAPRRS